MSVDESRRSALELVGGSGDVLRLCSALIGGRANGALIAPDGAGSEGAVVVTAGGGRGGVVSRPGRREDDGSLAVTVDGWSSVSVAGLESMLLGLDAVVLDGLAVAVAALAASAGLDAELGVETGGGAHLVGTAAAVAVAADEKRKDECECEKESRDDERNDDGQLRVIFGRHRPIFVVARPSKFPNKVADNHNFSVCRSVTVAEVSRGGSRCSPMRI